MAQKISVDMLSNADLEYLASKMSEDSAWEKYPFDAIHRENEVAMSKRTYKDNLLWEIKEAKAGKRPMPTVTHRQAGLERPQPQLRPPEIYNLRPKDEMDAYGLGSDLPYTRKQHLHLGFLEYPQARAPTLSNKILAPLAPRLWKVSDSQKKALDPVLRLVSKMYLSPASVHFIHAMRLAEPQEELTATRIWGIPLQMYGYPSANMPTKDLLQLAMESLNGLAKHISWGLMDSKSKEFEKYSNTDAVTIRERKPAGSRRKGGDGSKILVKHHFIAALETLDRAQVHAPADVSTHINKTLRLQLFVAKTICHELTHAVSFYLHPEWYRDPFFGSYNLTELGSTWEQEVLGGVINWWSTEADQTLEEQILQPISISKWPSTDDTGDYIFDQNPHGKAMELLRRYPKPSSTVWYLDMKWIDGLFHDEFWEGAEDSSMLLKAPRTFGFRCVASNEEFTDRHWRRSMSSERRSVDGMGRVVLEEGMREQLTP